MNVLIKMEVRARELEGRLLLAMVAAERGHDVLLGDLRALLSHRLWLPPAIYHDKSLTPSARKIALHARLVEAGFVVTSQDEEHGLLLESYDDFCAQRFSEASLAQAHASFAWGPHDGGALRRRYPALADRVTITGSPRVDLWRPEFAPFHAALPRPGLPEGRPYVLIASNATPLTPNPFWVMVRDKRSAYFAGPEDPMEFGLYAHFAREYTYLARLVRAIRRTSARFPDLTIVVRPHPTEADGAWADLLGPLPNVVVAREGGIGRWIRGATAVVHNGSTSGFEAAVAGVPVISFQPDGDRAEFVPNRLGRAARDEDELLALIDAAGRHRPGDDWGGEATRALLTDRLAALDGPLAADAIVDAWDAIDPAGRTTPDRLALARIAAGTHRRLGRVRAALASGRTRTEREFTTAHKFPPLARADVAGLVDALTATLPRLAAVRVRLVGPRLVRLRRA